MSGSIALLAGCGSPGEGPPAAALEPPGAPVAAAPPAATGTATATAGEGEVPGDTGRPGTGELEVCDLARDPAVMADVEGWPHYVPVLEAALPAEVDAAAALASLTPDTPVTPAVIAGLDEIWDLIDQHCDQDPRVEQCRSLIVIALADPLGWAVRAGDPAQVETAFALAVANWSDLRQRAAGDELRRAIDAHLHVLDGAGRALRSIGWAPGRIDVLGPLEHELVSLGDAAVVEPLHQLEADCGFH